MYVSECFVCVCVCVCGGGGASTYVRGMKCVCMSVIKNLHIYTNKGLLKNCIQSQFILCHINQCTIYLLVH